MTTTTSSAEETSDSLIALYNNLGVICAGNGDFARAGTYFDSALAQDAENSAILNNLGNNLLCEGNVSGAISYFEQSYSLDSTDKNKLYNWSIALYIADSLDESVEVMKNFLVYADTTEIDDDFYSVLSREMDLSKGDAKKLTKSEIDRLLGKASERMKKASKKKKQAADKSQQSDSTPPDDSAGPKDKKTKLDLAPAGAKSVELRGLASMLYWIVL
jgi:tetratricopeptide (TPR) repeat protein